MPSRVLQQDKDTTSRPSLARRLFLGAALWSLVVLVAGTLLLGAVYRAQTLRLLENELDRTTIELTRAVEPVEIFEDGRLIRDGRITTTDATLPEHPDFGVPLSGRYWAIVAVDPTGAPAGSITSDSVFDADPPINAETLAEALANPGQIVYGNAVGPNDEPVRLGIRAVRIENRSQPIVFTAAMDRSAQQAASRNFLILLVALMGVLAAGVLLAMYLQVRYGLQPLRQIAAHVNDIREGRRERLEEDYPSEVAPLTDELNALIEHNKEVVSRAQTHVGNLAHALKTPIAVLMNEASGDSDMDQLVRRQAETMQSNVQHYLKRAQAAARAEILGARSELEPVVADLSRLMERLFRDKALSIDVEVPETAVFRGERQDLEELLGNLLENAGKWATRRVRVSAAVENGRLQLNVDDDGPGLTPDQREIALKRGGRLDEQTPGTGLGLSIVSELVELHNGRLELSDAPLGGLRVAMDFPAG
jgi:signal transduction histidine kinase